MLLEKAELDAELGTSTPERGSSCQHTGRGRHSKGSEIYAQAHIVKDQNELHVTSRHDDSAQPT